LGIGTTAWSRQLSAAAWGILYQHVENLLRAKVSFIVESNFDPKYANDHWRTLKQDYNFHLVQIRCTTDAITLLQRYCQRIECGQRHQGHVDSRQDPAFIASIQKPMDWVAVESDRLDFDSTIVGKADYLRVAQQVRCLLSNIGFADLELETDQRFIMFQ
jgi:hypothetical protein